MKGRKTRATGGVNLAAEDLATRPMEYTKDSNVNRAALQRKRGGKTMEKMTAGQKPKMNMGGSMYKEGGPVEGMKSKMHMGRKPRKSGGRLAGEDWRSAEKGTPAKGRTTDGDVC